MSREAFKLKAHTLSWPKCYLVREHINKNREIMLKTYEYRHPSWARSRWIDTGIHLTLKFKPILPLITIDFKIKK